MFLPLGTDLRLRRPTVINHALIAVNLAVFIGMFAVTAQDPERFDAIVMKWGLIWIRAEWWRFATYSVIHDGIWHVAGNMLMLWVFGPPVEDRLGRLGYLALYVVGMVGSAAAHVATSAAPAVGASGAVAAIGGAFLVLFPMVHIRTLILFFVIGIHNIPALWFIGFFIAKDFLMAGFGSADNVARAAHLGGYGVGITVAFALQLFKIVPREPFDFLSLVKQAKRRNEIRSALAEAEGERKQRFGLANEERPGGSTSQASKAQGPVDAARSDALAAARAKVTDLIARERLPEAAAAYQELLAMHGPYSVPAKGPIKKAAGVVAEENALPGTAVMSRRPQMVLANWFFEQARHAEAMSAFERYVAAYPLDSETPHVKLLMALIAARYLKQVEKARTLIGEAMPKLRDEEQQGLARQILQELGAGDGSGAVDPGRRT